MHFFSTLQRISQTFAQSFAVECQHLTKHKYAFWLNLYHCLLQAVFRFKSRPFGSPKGLTVFTPPNTPKIFYISFPPQTFSQSISQRFARYLKQRRCPKCTLSIYLTVVLVTDRQLKVTVLGSFENFNIFLIF